MRQQDRPEDSLALPAGEVHSRFSGPHRPLEAATTNRHFGLAPPEDKEAMVGYGNFALTMDTLERAVEGGGYVAGENFTATDVYVGSHIAWGLYFDLIEKRPAFEAYRSRLARREAYLRATALDDAAGGADGP